MDSSPLIVPRTYWNKESIFDYENLTYKAVNERDWLLLRLGIKPLYVNFMCNDEKYFMLSEMYCLNASTQLAIIDQESIPSLTGIYFVINDCIKDPYKGQYIA